MIKCGNCGEFGHNKRTCKPQSQEVTEDNGDEMLAENHPNTDFSDIEEMDILYWLQMQHNKLRLIMEIKCQQKIRATHRFLRLLLRRQMKKTKSWLIRKHSKPVLPENEQPSAQMPTNRNQQSKKGRTCILCHQPSHNKATCTTEIGKWIKDN